MIQELMKLLDIAHEKEIPEIFFNYYTIGKNYAFTLDDQDYEIQEGDLIRFPHNAKIGDVGHHMDSGDIGYLILSLKICLEAHENRRRVK